MGIEAHCFKILQKRAVRVVTKSNSKHAYTEPVHQQLNVPKTMVTNQNHVYPFFHGN